MPCAARTRGACQGRGGEEALRRLATASEVGCDDDVGGGGDDDNGDDDDDDDNDDNDAENKSKTKKSKSIKT